MTGLRFRAWDREKRQWFVPTHKAYERRLEVLQIGLEGDLFLKTMEGSFHESTFPNRFVVVQSTGLFDRRGVEIFEGHIIRKFSLKKPPNDHSDGKAVLVHRQPSSCGFNLRMPGKKNPTHEYEVIGDIYQSPDLLKHETS